MASKTASGRRLLALDKVLGEVIIDMSK